MSENLKITTSQNLYEMLKTHEIVIPIIQRDYAQGRNNINVKEIRENFINDILKKLLKNKKLKLSFVYGTEEGNQYVPYDGQQRLTLVFLMMLYFSEYAEENISELSKFSYRTRDFSVDFCKYITSADGFFKNNKLSEIDQKENALKEVIQNDINFFSAWLSDPTVYSMIVVLQTIHTLFYELPLSEGITDKKQQASDFINKLKNGYLFFDWCTLNASDSIYVKMNGRGKTLSAFDNFKNTLFGVLNELRAKETEDSPKLKFLENFEQKMDSDWTDLFWQYRSNFVDNNTENVNIASAMMNFFYFAFEYRNVAKNKKFFFGNGEAVRWLDENKIVSFLSIFKTTFRDNDLNIDDYIWLSKILDILSQRLKSNINIPITNPISQKIFFDEKKLFVSLGTHTDRYDYESHITAAIYYSYLIHASKFDETGLLIKVSDSHKEEWAEFIININQTVQFFNSHFNDLVNDKKVYVAIDSIINKVFAASEIGDLVSAVSKITQKDVDEWKKHFTLHADNQLQEEYEKLLLKNKDPSWSKLIAEANNIPYFNGQIYFILDSAKDDSGNVNQQLFSKFISATKALVNQTDNSKLIDDNTLRCILLSFGDYRIDSSQSFSNAKSLCENWVKGTAKYFLWKSFFDVLYSNKNVFIKKLLIALSENNNDPSETLKTCKKNCTDTNWTSIIVKYPEILNYIGQFGIIDTDTGNGNPYIITSDGVKKLVRDEHLDNYAVNIYLYGLYRDLGFKDSGNISSCLRDVWLLPTKQTIKLLGNNSYELSKDGIVIHTGSFEDILNVAEKVTF